MKNKTIKKEVLYNIIYDLQQEAESELFNNDFITQEQAIIIYGNINTFILKLKNKIEE